MHASNRNLSKKLENGIKILVGQAVLELLIKHYFDCFVPQLKNCLAY